MNGVLSNNNEIADISTAPGSVQSIMEKTIALVSQKVAFSSICRNRPIDVQSLKVEIFLWALDMNLK